MQKFTHNSITNYNLPGFCAVQYNHSTVLTLQINATILVFQKMKKPNEGKVHKVVKPFRRLPSLTHGRQQHLRNQSRVPLLEDGSRAPLGCIGPVACNRSLGIITLAY